VPIAIVAGLSRAARRGIVVKGGSALEALAGVRTMLLDKTGTVTIGQPTVEEIEAHGVDADTLLQLTASLEEASPHAIASAIVAEARERGLALTVARDVTEDPGLGLVGTVGDRVVAVGQDRWLLEHAGVTVEPPWVRGVREHIAHHSSAAAWVAFDSDLVGAIVLADPIRDDAGATVAALRLAGIEHIALVSGDRAAPAERVGARLGVDSVIAECTPARKVEVVTATRRKSPCAMVGDGINDAPALAAATVGIALGARGATAASEAADVVITVDSFDRVVEAVRIARRSRRIAVQSATLGMGLAAIGMAAAALGWLPPAPGAIAQEAIDIVAILSALRALLPGRAQ
jgi:P-type E1-E2 ATPase